MRWIHHTTLLHALWLLHSYVICTLSFSNVVIKHQSKIYVGYWPTTVLLLGYAQMVNCSFTGWIPHSLLASNGEWGLCEQTIYLPSWPTFLMTWFQSGHHKPHLGAAIINSKNQGFAFCDPTMIAVVTNLPKTNDLLYMCSLTADTGLGDAVCTDYYSSVPMKSSRGLVQRGFNVTWFQSGVVTPAHHERHFNAAIINPTKAA